MKTRQLGNSDLHLTTIGFGAWAIGGGDYAFGWGAQDDNDSIRAIHEALDLGINWIDTAPVYGLGRSEEVVGRAIKDRRDKVIVATKCGLIWDADRNITRHIKADSIRKEVDDSLRRLNIDVIDLYQIHWPTDDLEEGWEAVVRLVETGKIRYPAVCNFGADQMEIVKKYGAITSLQPPYSMFRRDAETEDLPYCGENTIGVVAYSPMQKGLLTGKFTPERVASLDKTDLRTRDADFKEPALSVNIATIEKLRTIAADHDRSVTQLALAWVLRRPEVTSAITGTRKPGQISETAPAGDWNLDASTIDAVEAILRERNQLL